MSSKIGGGNGTATLGPAKHLPKPIGKDVAKDVTKNRAYSHPALSNHDARRVGVEALCNPRAVFKYLYGMPQRAMMRERIERALRALHLEHLIGYKTRAAATAAENARSAKD